MYHKIKSTLTGLSFVLAFVATGALFADPIPTAPSPATRTLSPEAREAALALAVVQTALRIAEHELTAAAQRTEAEVRDELEASRARRSARLKRELGMPYYSFGTLLPRRGES
jgi:hypothetical protein